MADGQGMAQRNEFRGFLCRHDAGDPGDSQHVALLVPSLHDQGQRAGLHRDDPFSHGDAVSRVLGGDVHHVRLSCLIEMG